MLDYCLPVHAEQKSRDDPDRSSQKNLAEIFGYIVAFTCTAQKLINLSKEEKLHKFLCGLCSKVLEKVLM